MKCEFASGSGEFSQVPVQWWQGLGGLGDVPKWGGQGEGNRSEGEKS